MQEQFWDTIEAIRGRNLKDRGIIIYTNKLQKKWGFSNANPTKKPMVNSGVPEG